MCTGRVDLAFILRAFAKGADGVFIGGCWPGECHYITEGNYDALSNTHLSKRLLKQVGLDPDRLRLEWISASEGSRFAEVMNEFVGQLKEMGPLGEAEGQSERQLESNLAAVTRLVPYMKLVERERLRIPVKSVDVYNEFWSGDEAERLFQELIGDKLTVSQIMELLRDNPMSTGEISEALGLTPSVVSKQMNRSSRQGLVTYDVDQLRYVLA